MFKVPNYHFRWGLQPVSLPPYSLGLKGTVSLDSVANTARESVKLETIVPIVYMHRSLCHGLILALVVVENVRLTQKICSSSFVD